jgi:HB1, ASXL, restriction endonuclease HTH domain
MTFLEAAEVVLRDAGEPLTYKEITDRALRLGLVETHGKTPAATMNSALYTAPVDTPIRRIYRPTTTRAADGSGRAAKGSIRWAITS